MDNCSNFWMAHKNICDRDCGEGEYTDRDTCPHAKSLEKENKAVDYYNKRDSKGRFTSRANKPIVKMGKKEVKMSVLDCNQSSKVDSEQVIGEVNGGKITFNGKYVGFAVEGQKPAYFYPSELVKAFSNILTVPDCVTIAKQFGITDQFTKTKVVEKIVEVPVTPALPKSRMANRIALVENS